MIDSLLAARSIQGVESIDLFRQKANLPHGLYMPNRGLPNGVPNFVIYPRAVALCNVLAWAARVQDTAYVAHRLRAPFVRVIIVALFDSNLVLGSFVLIY